MRQELYKKLNNNLKKQSLNSLAGEIGLLQPTLFRIVKKQSQGHIKAWEKIESFYRKRK